MEKIFKVAVLSILLLCAVPFAASAATLSLKVPLDTYQEGDTFSLGVYVGSADQSVNAFSATLSYPTNLLSVTSASKAGSIISLWAQEPTFSNADGTASFEGVMPNPGFKAASGKLVTYTFQVKRAGTATISFSGANVLANDGQATNVLSGTGTATISLKAKAEEVPVKKPTQEQTKPVQPVQESPVTEAIQDQTIPVQPLTSEEQKTVTEPTRPVPSSPLVAQALRVIDDARAHPLLATTAVAAGASILSVLLSFAVRIARLGRLIKRGASVQEVSRDFFKRRTPVPVDIVKKHISALKKAKRARDLTDEESHVLRDLEDLAQ